MADPFSSPIVEPRATGILSPEDDTNAKAKAPPGAMTVQQFATGIKKRQPELSVVPDDVLVRRMIEVHPELIHNIQTSQPRPPMRDRNRQPTGDQAAQKFFQNHPLIREGALALAGGVGIPESTAPVSDMRKGLWKTISDPPQTDDERAIYGMEGGRSGILPAYRIAKGIVQQGYGYGQEAFDAIDWKKIMASYVGEHKVDLDILKQAHESAFMPDPKDPHKTIPNPKAGQGIEGTSKAPQLVHGLVGLATVLYTALKSPKQAAGVVDATSKAATTAADKAGTVATDTIQRAAGTGTHLADTVASKAVERTAEENVKIGERNATTAEKHAAATEKVTDHNTAAEQDFKTKIERLKNDFGERVAKVREDYANDVKVRDQKVAELGEQYARQVADVRKEWVQKTHASKTAEATKQSVENRKEVLEHTQRAYVDRIKENVAHTYSVVKGKLDSRYTQMRKRPAAVLDEATGENREMPLQDIPLDSVKLKESVDKGRKTLQGAPADLKVFNDLVRQMEQGDGSLMDATDGAEPTLRPLTWDEGHTHFSALGDKLYSGELPGNVAKAIREVRQAMDAELESTATKAVTLKDGQAAGAAMKREYGQLKKDWSQFEGDWRDAGSQGKGGSPLAHLRLSVDRPVVAAHVLGKFGDRLIETISKYKDSGANPSLFDETRRYSREAKSGKVNVSRYPGNVESVPSKVSVPKAPGKLDIPAPPKEPAPVPSPDAKVAAIEGEGAKRVERATEDKPEPKPLPATPVPEAAKKLPTTDELVKELKEAKTKKAKGFAEDQSRPTKHDAIMIAVATAGAGAAGHLGYAAIYLPIRFGWSKFLRSEVGMRTMTRITEADVKTMREVLDKMPEEKPAAQQAITGWLTEQAKAKKPMPPLKTFEGLLDKAQIGAILRLIAPPQPAPATVQNQ